MRLQAKVREALATAQTDGCQLVLPERLDRTVYSHVSRALENAGGQWSRKAKAFVFPGDAAAAIAPLLVTGEVEDARIDHGAFYTPPVLALSVVGRAAIRPGMQVLEPSAGGGALAALARGAGAHVTCVEIRAQAAARLRALSPAEMVHEADFLTLTPRQLGFFDRVVMNPPFARRQDILHVEHALRFLRPGGRLVALVSAGIESRSDAATVRLRERIQEQGGSIERLPPGSFRSAGTDVQVCLVDVALQRFFLPSTPVQQLQGASHG
jgi:predicted RNA methylase